MAALGNQCENEKMKWLKSFLGSSLILFLSANLQAQTLRLGKVSFPNSGKPEAQEAFLDGLAALHCFWYGKAAEKFREAEKADPEFALAYWGEAMTFNHDFPNEVNLEQGRSVLNKLGKTAEEREAKGRTEIEKTLIRSLDYRYGDGTQKERNEKYIAILKQLYEKNRNNIEVVTFYALSILGTAPLSDPGFRQHLQSAKIMEDYLKNAGAEALQHPGLLHYLIHAYDNSQYAKKGLKYADLYAAVSPDSAHALHMPSHIFLQMGLWDKVVKQNEDAYQISVKWAKADHLGYEAYDYHSYYWLFYGYLQQRRMKDAKAILTSLSEISKLEPTVRSLGHYEMMKARFVLEQEQWDSQFDFSSNMEELDKQLNTGLHAGCATNLPERSRVTSFFTLGIRAAKAGKQEVEERVLQYLERLKEEYRNEDYEVNKRIINISKLAISGISQMTRGFTQRGLQLLKMGAEDEQRLGAPSGFPSPAKPAGEIYAEALLEANRPKEALEWFHKSLERTPNRTAALTGALQASQKLKDKKSEIYYRGVLQIVLSSADPEIRVRILGQ